MQNGQPFAGLGIAALTELSIWWLKLGIMPERMHRTLKEATALPPKTSFIEQQHSFDAFRNEYNNERPHQALGGKRPADIYVPSQRILSNIVPEVIYPHDFEIRKVRTNGEIKWGGKKYYVTGLLHGEPLGLQMIGDGTAILYFARLKLGIIDAREDKIIRP